jgi:hypothetical protein
VIGRPNPRDRRGSLGRFRAVLAIAALTLAAVAVAGGIGMSASTPTPILRTFALKHSAVPSSGGVIRIKVTAAHATSCVISSSPGIHGLPKAVSCKSGVASLSLNVPSNRTFVTRRFHVSARAAHLEVSSPTSYRWLTQVATPRVMTCVGGTVIHPSYYLIACGDGNAWWQKVKWASWGANTAVGNGQIVVNDCIPFCFDGHFHAYPLAVHLSHLRQTTKYGLLYEGFTLSYSIKGKHFTDSEPFPSMFVAGAH